MGLLRTAHPLDEARGYCLDIAGFGATLRLDDPLQAHTCKYGSELDDQRFEPIAGGAIKTGIGDRCLAATALEPGAKLVVRSCTSAPTQRWTLTWGRLTPDSQRELCVSVASGTGEIAGTPALISPVYRRRDVTLERCDDAQQARQSFRWSLPDERTISSANVLRTGMPPTSRSSLRRSGPSSTARLPDRRRRSTRRSLASTKRAKSRSRRVSPMARTRGSSSTFTPRQCAGPSAPHP
jgi:hypothetical protein